MTNLNTSIKDLIIQVRKITSAGMLQCKKALEETEYDVEKAVDWLKKKGIAKAMSKSDREVKQGVISVYLDESHCKGVLLQVNCETDFVARNDKFQSFVQKITQLASTVKDIDSLMEIDFDDKNKVSEALAYNISFIGENLVLSNMKKISVDSNHDNNIGALGFYVHNALRDGMGSMGSIVSISCSGNTDDKAKIKQELTQFARSIAIQVVSLDADFVSVDHVKSDVDNTKSNYSFLLDQDYILDEKYTIKEFLQNEQNRLGVKDLSIDGFIKMRLGG